MKKNRFRFIKYVSELIIMYGYFNIAYCTIWGINKTYGMIFTLTERASVITSILYCLTLYIFLCLLEGLSIGKRRILDLIFGFFFSALCVNLISGFICLAVAPVPVWEMAVIVLILILIETLVGFAWIMCCHRSYEKFHFCKEAIFIYGSREDEGEYVRVNNTINKYFKISKSLNYQIGPKQILKEIQESSVVFLGDIPVEIRNVVLKFCMSREIECYGIPKISDIYIQSAEVMQLNDKLLLKYPGIAISGWRKLAKRMMDIIVSLLMLVLASPVMLVIAVLIKREDGGKIIYRQDRVTLDSRPFHMLKFRSMREDAEKEGARLAGKNDDRVTKVGRVIRNLHFDELPQLVNVLRGEMSLVGPRPERQEFIDLYAKRIPEFPERLKVRGGLTGYAQVYGRYNSEPEDKIKYDLYYIYNYSLLLDIKLIILTVRILFQKENTEGVKDGQISALKEK